MCSFFVFVDTQVHHLANFRSWNLPQLRPLVGVQASAPALHVCQTSPTSLPCHAVLQDALCHLCRDTAHPLPTSPARLWVLSRACTITSSRLQYTPHHSRLKYTPHRSHRQCTHPPCEDEQTLRSSFHNVSHCHLNDNVWCTRVI